MNIIRVCAAQLMVHVERRVSAEGLPGVDNEEGQYLANAFITAIKEHTKRAFRSPEVQKGESREGDRYLQAVKEQCETVDVVAAPTMLSILLYAALAARLVAEPNPDFTEFMEPAS